MKRKESKRRLKPWATRVLLITVGVLAMSACAGKSRYFEPPALAQDWLGSLSVGRARLATISTEARVEVRRGERRTRFVASILVASPDRIFVEVSGFGIPSSLASVKGDQIFLYMPPERTAYQGSAQEGLTYLLGVKMTTQEWVALLLGLIPELPSEILEFEPGHKETMLVLGKKNNPIILTIDGQTGWLTSYKYKEPRERQVSFGAPLRTTSGDYPSRITITTAEGFVDIRFKDVIGNSKLSEELFVIEVPLGVSTKRLQYEKLLKKQ